MEIGAWIAIVLAGTGFAMNVALAIDNWVHRQTYQGSEQGTRLAKMEAEWEKFKNKQSEVADRWQAHVGTIEVDAFATKLQLARIEEHLKFIDRHDTPRRHDRPR